MIIEISKGYQITIPADIRNALDLGIGSPLDIERKAGKIIINPIKGDLNDMFRNAKSIKPKKKMNIEDMEELNKKMFR